MTPPGSPEGRALDHYAEVIGYCAHDLREIRFVLQHLDVWLTAMESLNSSEFRVTRGKQWVCTLLPETSYGATPQAAIQKAYMQKLQKEFDTLTGLHPTEEA